MFIFSDYTLIEEKEYENTRMINDRIFLNKNEY